ncbi:MAG: hypothetical protein K0Q89_2486 [Thermomicrobiales bacterium]|nr:hypothetical protein [Thermomicrobiales bacterium]
MIIATVYGYGIHARYRCQLVAGPVTAAITALLNLAHRTRMNPHMCVTVRLANTARAISRSGSPQRSVPAWPKWQNVLGEVKSPVQ